MSMTNERCQDTTTPTSTPSSPTRSLLSSLEPRCHRQGRTDGLRPDRYPAGDGRVNHEYPYASTQEGGRGADVTSQPRSESDIEGRILKNLYNRQNVKAGDRFTSTYRGGDGQARCIQCAAARQQQQNQQQGAANSQRDSAIRSASSSNSGGQHQAGQQSGHRNGAAKPNRPHRNESTKPKKQSSSHKKRKGQK